MLVDRLPRQLQNRIALRGQHLSGTLSAGSLGQPSSWPFHKQVEMCTQLDSDSIAGVERSEAGVEGFVVLVVFVRFVVVAVVVVVVVVVVITLVTVAVVIFVVVVVLVSAPPCPWFMLPAS